MVVLITGGNDNGKSEYAEDLVIKLSPGGKSFGYTRLYLATMSAKDDESLVRIKKHVLRRKDMEYITIEKSNNLGELDLSKYGSDDDFYKGHRILLIEDIPNLLAGEMFRDGEFYPEVSGKITNDIKKMVSVCEHTVIVTNEVFSDGMVYDEYTTTYLREFGIVNQNIAAMSDEVYELVCGIPVTIKA